MTSSNAVSWTVQDALLAPSLYNVVYGNGRFVTVGSVANSAYGEIVTSINGITYGNNRFVTVGRHGDCVFTCHFYPDIYTSANGLQPWANQFPPGLDFSLVEVAYGTNIFVT